MLAPRHSALCCKAFANMDTSNEMETDVLQVSSTSDERPTSQGPSHALAVIQTAAKASSESDSSPHVHGRNRSSGSVRSASAVALGSRHARTPSPYARNKAKPVMLSPVKPKLRYFRLLPTRVRSRLLWRIRLATRYLSILRVPHPQPQMVVALPPRHQRFTCVSINNWVWLCMG